MRVSTRIDANELPDRFREVLKIIPEDSWQHRARILADRERQNPFLEQYFDERYAIERCIVRALAHGIAPVAVELGKEALPTLSH
jgi:hypothetical protein